MESPLIPIEVAEVAFTHALGWIKERTDDLLQHQAPARIRYDEFATEMRAFVRKIDLRRILISYAPTPSRETIEANRVRTYVQQLELIEVQEEDKIQAINDCLRAEIDRTKWSTQGIIHESSLDDLWSTLSTFWKNKNAQNAITHKHLTIVEQANILYRDCMMLRLPLEGLEVPNHFTPESFHTLADDEEVGWHRDYKNLLATRRMAGHNEHAEQRTPRRQHEPTLTPITHRINVSLRRGSLKVDISPPNLSTAAGVIIQREIVTRHGLAIGISEYPRWIPFSVQTWLSQIEIAQRLGKFL